MRYAKMIHPLTNPPMAMLVIADDELLADAALSEAGWTTADSWEGQTVAGLMITTSGRMVIEVAGRQVFDQEDSAGPPEASWWRATDGWDGRRAVIVVPSGFDLDSEGVGYRLVDVLDGKVSSLWATAVVTTPAQ